MFVDWGIKLTLESKESYALKYGVIYAIIIAVILIMPLFVYTQLVVNINEAKTELFLKQRAYEIIGKMDHFKPTDKEDYFDFPRFNESKAGLYDANFKPIFSLIEVLPTIMIKGYYEYGNRRFFVQPLPSKRYFGADYLIIEGQSQNYEIYQRALIIGLLILFILFIISYFIFKQFSIPFERVNRQLDNFMKDSMHEINTPLSIINVNIDLFSRKNGENKYLSRIKAASKTLSNIYNDMDYLIKQDIVTYHPEKLDMSTFVEERVDYFQEVAAQREIEIRTDITKEITFYFNKTKLQRIIDNTLSNAIKYSFEGKKIDVILKENAHSIIFVVRDYGVGIKNPEKILTRYYREDQNKGGFGIGLNIVKKIIDEHQIKLEIDSIVAQGSTFRYRFSKE